MAYSKGTIRVQFDKVVTFLRRCTSVELAEFVFNEFTRFKATERGWTANHGGYNLRITRDGNAYTVSLHSGLSDHYMDYVEIEVGKESGQA